MPHEFKRFASGCLGCLSVVASGWSSAQVPSVPQRADINLASTSFYDGFSGAPGLTWLSWLRHSKADSIRDNAGHPVAAFQNPRIQSTAFVNQFSYSMPTLIGGWRPMLNAIVPLVSLDSSFGPGPSLKDSGSGVGDITVGAGLQSMPVMGENGKPVFSQRLEFDVILPTGKYRGNSDLNPGAGYASLNPYWAATLLPAERWELSWRLHYLYNFRNDSPAASNPVSYAGGPVTSTQAGQAGWLNFSGSYSVTPDVSVGLSGYYFQQLTDSRANRTAIADARERVLGIGPGLMWRVAPDKAVWLNTYTESMVRNRTRSPLTVQLRTAITF